MKLGLHFCLVLIINVSWLNVTNSLIQKKGTTSKNRPSGDDLKLNTKRKRVGGAPGKNRLESSEALDGVGTSLEIDKLFKRWRGPITPHQNNQGWGRGIHSRMFRDRSGFNSNVNNNGEGSKKVEDVLNITPATGPIINKEDFPKLKAEAEQNLIQSATLDKKGRNPWVQINDDSIDLAQTTTLETTMHNIWQKESKTDCGVEAENSTANRQILEKCTKAMIEIDEFLATQSNGADYGLDGVDYFNDQENKNNYCKIK